MLYMLICILLIISGVIWLSALIVMLVAFIREIIRCWRSEK